MCGDALNTESCRPWPTMPGVLLELEANAASPCGFEGFVPDACLINHYAPGMRLSPHKDRDELDYSQPIVSVSVGIPAVFLFGGLKREDRCLRVPLGHGDVVVGGGPVRLRFHGMLPLDAASHPVLGVRRVSLTFRKVG